MSSSHPHSHANCRYWGTPAALLPPQVTGALSPVEASLLSTRLQDLERCLEPGLVRLNWNNRGIDAFVASTSKAIQEFQGLHHSVQKNSAIVEKLVSGLAAAKLVADLPEGEARRAVLLA